jgi:hypothetical protein
LEIEPETGILMNIARCVRKGKVQVREARMAAV